LTRQDGPEFFKLLKGGAKFHIRVQRIKAGAKPPLSVASPNRVYPLREQEAQAVTLKTGVKPWKGR
jgi:hypothetical protein